MDQSPTGSKPDGVNDAEYGAAGLRLGVIDAATLVRARQELGSLRSGGMLVSLRWLLLRSGVLSPSAAMAIEAHLGIEVVDHEPVVVPEPAPATEPEAIANAGETSIVDFVEQTTSVDDDAAEDEKGPEIADVLIDPDAAIPFAFEDVSDELLEQLIRDGESVADQSGAVSANADFSPEPEPEASESTERTAESAEPASVEALDEVLSTSAETDAESIDVPEPTASHEPEVSEAPPAPNEEPVLVAAEQEAPETPTVESLTPSQPRLTAAMIAAAAGSVATPPSDVFADDPEVVSKRSRRRIVIGLLLVTLSVFAGAAYLPDVQPFRALIGGKESKGVLGWWNQFAAHFIGGRTPSE